MSVLRGVDRFFYKITTEKVKNLMFKKEEK